MHLLFFFVSGFSRHVGSPVWLLILAPQYAPSPSSPALSPTVCIYHLHTSFHLLFGLPLLPNPVSLSSYYVLFFPPHHVTILFQSSLRYLFRCLRYFRRSSNVFDPDLVIPGHPTHPPQRPHPINLNPCFLSFGGGP